MNVLFRTLEAAPVRGAVVSRWEIVGVMGQLSPLLRLPDRAERPSADSLFRLGLRYWTPTDGSEPDSITAHALFELAARQGSLEAKVYRRELSEEMDRADIVEARRLARDWLTEV